MQETVFSQLTFKELKEAVNKLTDEQLTQKVFVIREDETIRVAALELVEEDIYNHLDDPEDAGTLEELKELKGDDFFIEAYRVAFPKGFPLMHEFF